MAAQVVVLMATYQVLGRVTCGGGDQGSVTQTGVVVRY